MDKKPQRPDWTKKRFHAAGITALPKTQIWSFFQNLSPKFLDIPIQPRVKSFIFRALFFKILANIGENKSAWNSALKSFSQIWLKFRDS